MKAELAIDYARGMEPFRSEPYEEIERLLREELPDVWLQRYHRMCDGPTNVLEVAQPPFIHLFDFVTQLVDEGLLAENAREDRVVVAHGSSQRQEKKRPASRIRGFPGSDERGDRGHLIAHSFGGGSDINLVHENARLNRGWSAEGKRYREMERYCEEHPNTFVFNRLIYADATARPAEIEFGILTRDRELWVEVFANVV